MDNNNYIDKRISLLEARLQIIKQIEDLRSLLKNVEKDIIGMSKNKNNFCSKCEYQGNNKKQLLEHLNEKHAY